MLVELWWKAKAKKKYFIVGEQAQSERGGEGHFGNLP